MALAEWIRERQRLGGLSTDEVARTRNVYAVEAAKRLLKEFGDVSTPSAEVSGIWNTSVLLTDLQALPNRSVAAERRIIETTFHRGTASLVSESGTQEVRYLVSANKWVFDVEGQPDQPEESLDDFISKEVRFGGFRLGLAEADDRWHLTVRELNTRRLYGIPVENLGGIAEIFEPTPETH